MTFLQYSYMICLYLLRELRNQIFYMYDQNNHVYNIQPYMNRHNNNNDMHIHIRQEEEIYLDNDIGYDIEIETEIVMFSKTPSFGQINATNDSYNQGIALRAFTDTTVSADNA